MRNISIDSIIIDNLTININMGGDDGVSGVMHHVPFADIMHGLGLNVGNAPIAQDDDAVTFPLTYEAIAELSEGDRVQWDGVKVQCQGTVAEDVYGAFDSDQGKDVLVVRINRDDGGKTVKLNLASDHKGTLTLLA